jgi:hypothetical protein
MGQSEAFKQFGIYGFSLDQNHRHHLPLLPLAPHLPQFRTPQCRRRRVSGEEWLPDPPQLPQPIGFFFQMSHRPIMKM